MSGINCVCVCVRVYVCLLKVEMVHVRVRLLKWWVNIDVGALVLTSERGCLILILNLNAFVCASTVRG